jgi:hypothetical protein
MCDAKRGKLFLAICRFSESSNPTTFKICRHVCKVLGNTTRTPADHMENQEYAGQAHRNASRVRVNTARCTRDNLKLQKDSEKD